MTRSLFSRAAFALLASSALTAQARESPLQRAACFFPRQDWMNGLQIECFTLAVPESRRQANGRTLHLAVVVVRAATPSQTPLVMLHGGPGGNGIQTYLAAARTDLARNRDYIVYDQRGAGYSEPKLCPDFGAGRDSTRRLRTLEMREAIWDAEERACVAWLKDNGVDRSAYNTVESAADMIDLRKALGYSSWNVYGGSYGARLAQEAMRQDSSAIRSVILESPVTRGPAFEVEMGMSAQRAVERVWADCGAQSACHAAFPEIGAEFLHVYDELTKAPLPVLFGGPSALPDSLWLDGAKLVSLIRDQILGRPGRLSRLPQLVHELRSGDRSAAARTIMAFDTAGAAANPRGNGQVLVHLVNCADEYSAATLKRRDSVNALVHPAFRRKELEECPLWQTRFSDAGRQQYVRSDLPVLILTGRYDDRTPTDHARRIASVLGNARLYEFPNEGHGARPVGCHMAILAAFLDHPSNLPDTSCMASSPRIQFAAQRAPAP